MTKTGVYKAILRPYNFQVSGWVPNGVADVTVTEETVEIKSWLDDSADVVHMQSIHLGSECPELRHDSNQDGYIDYKESLAVSQKAYVPLDANLASPSVNAYPKSDFIYYQKAKIEDMGFEAINLENKVIIILGSMNNFLPNTVSTVHGMTRSLSIPIACGILEKRAEVSLTE